MDLYDKIVYICEKIYENASCDACPIHNMSPNVIGWGCPFTVRCPFSWPDKEKLNSVVDKWIEKHPVKTRQSEFLKLFPNHPFKFNNGYIALCPQRVVTTFEPVDKNLCINDGCRICLEKYWSEEVE